MAMQQMIQEYLAAPETRKQATLVAMIRQPDEAFNAPMTFRGPYPAPLPVVDVFPDFLAPLLAALLRQCPRLLLERDLALRSAGERWSLLAAAIDSGNPLFADVVLGGLSARSPAVQPLLGCKKPGCSPNYGVDFGACDFGRAKNGGSGGRGSGRGANQLPQDTTLFGTDVVNPPMLREPVVSAAGSRNDAPGHGADFRVCPAAAAKAFVSTGRATADRKLAVLIQEQLSKGCNGMDGFTDLEMNSFKALDLTASQRF